jgi:hypothetical protein
MRMNSFTTQADKRNQNLKNAVFRGKSRYAVATPYKRDGDRMAPRATTFDTSIDAPVTHLRFLRI